MKSTQSFFYKINKLADEFDMLPDGGIVMVGVSGGADSMCLLDALLEISAARGFKVSAAHFNHKLRGDESDSDELFVIRECKNRDIELITDSADVMSYAADNGMGKVEAARELRYAFFEKAAADLSKRHDVQTVRIATAHNADDLAETIIINLARGSGMSGMAGIPPKRGPIIRPMLHISRNEIEEYIRAKGLKYVEDSSNSLQNQVRNKIRHSVIPILREINPRFTDTAIKTAQLNRHDEDYLSSIAKQYSNTEFLSASEIAPLPYAIKSRVIRQMCRNRLSHEHVIAVIGLIGTGRPSASLSLPGITVHREYDKVFFEHFKHSGHNTDSVTSEDGADRKKPGFAPIALHAGDDFFIHEAGLRVICSHIEYDNAQEESAKIKTFCTFLFHIDEICGTMSVGSRREGDKIRLFGSNHTKSLKKLFIDNRVPVAKRGLIPVIFDEQGVLAVYGLCRSNRALPKTGNNILKIEFISQVGIR